MPLLRRMSVETPSCFSAERCTSTTRTFRVTWSEPATLIMLTSFSGAETKARATCAARWASPGLAAVPVRMMLSLTASARMFAPGATRLSVSCSALVPASTRTRSARMVRPVASRKTASVSPAAIPITVIRRGECSMASATCGLDTITSRASAGRSTANEVPRGRLTICGPAPVETAARVWAWEADTAPPRAIRAAQAATTKRFMPGFLMGRRPLRPGPRDRHARRGRRRPRLRDAPRREPDRTTQMCRRRNAAPATVRLRTWPEPGPRRRGR
ncbi:hypothetical protein D3C86_1182330 [compost metagenome]